MKNNPHLDLGPVLEDEGRAARRKWAWKEKARFWWNQFLLLAALLGRRIGAI